MAGGARGSVVRSIQTLIDAGPVAGLTDGQLLDQFLERQGTAAEAAFAAIVKLHGPMVWGVCRGALADSHDAEDAFQATFLILVRKAGSVRRRDTLGPWLYGVARRVAVRAKAGTLRRKRREGAGVDEMAAIPTPDPFRKEDVDILHQELDRLSEKYRAVVVLCHLEGRTQAEAARLLGCPIGTVGVRVSRARELLRVRLTRRGVALPAALAGAMLAPASASASATVPAALAASTVKAAMGVAAGKSLAVGGVSAAVVHLTQGVLRTMTLAKLIIVSASVLTVGLASTGIGWIALGNGPARVELPGASAPPIAAPREEPNPDQGKEPIAVAANLDDDKPPEGWGGGGMGYSLIRDSDVKHGGKSSGLIESTSRDANGFGTFTQGIRAEKYRGKRVRLSAHAKSSKVTGKAGLWMRIDGKTKSPLGFDNMMNRPIKGTTDWKEYSVVLDVPEDSKDIYFGFLMAGRGRAWVDDMQFEVVGKDVKVTGLKVQASDQQGNSEFTLPDEPINVDFEK